MSIASRRSQRMGAQAQRIVVRLLRVRGYKCVTEIATKMRKFGTRWVFAEKAAGDIRAVGPGGISVLAECKMRSYEHVVWSDLEAHQIASLNEHLAAGGQSLLVLVGNGTAQVLSWSALIADGFGPRQACDTERCKRCALSLDMRR